MSLEYNPFAENEDLEQLRETLWTNGNPSERKGSLVSGVAIIAAGLACKGYCRWAACAAGIALIYRGATGHCAVYKHLGISTQKK